MRSADDAAPGGGPGASSDQVDAGSTPTIPPTNDKAGQAPLVLSDLTPVMPYHLIDWLAAQLKARRVASARLVPLDSGVRDPLDLLHLPEAARPCSRWFACRAQSIEVLQRWDRCPCDEAREVTP